MKKPDYNQHEITYQQLLANGYTGWGAEAFDRRMEGWKVTVNSLLQSEFFPKSGQKILELGSGAGDGLIPFAEKGFEVTGVEISSTAVQWSKNKFKEKNLNGEFLVANVANNLPFADQSFSAVLDGACLHCIIGEDRKVAFSEAFRVLRFGGFFLVSHMVNDPRELSVELTFDPETRVQSKNQVPYRYMPTLKQLENEIIAAGLKILKVNVRENAWWDHAEIWCCR